MKDIKEQLSELREESKELTRKIDRLEKQIQPEFKLPAWYKYNNCLEEIFRATSQDGVYLYDAEGTGYYKKSCIPATPQEIESHLRCIAIEKGFKEGIRFRSYGQDIRTASGKMEYNPYWMSDEDAFAIGYDIIWRAKKGWAEILPSLKPAPETFDELLQFGVDIQKEYIKNGPLSVADFIRKNYDI
jgi:hypothetical protein